MNSLIKTTNKYIIVTIAVLMSSFHVYTAVFGSLEGMLQRNVHLLFAIILILLIYPITKNKEESLKGIITNWVTAIIGSLPFFWIIIDYSRIVERWPLTDEVETF